MIYLICLEIQPKWNTSEILSVKHFFNGRNSVTILSCFVCSYIFTWNLYPYVSHWSSGKMEIEETWSILGLLLALWPGFVTPHPEIVPQHKSNCSGSVGRHTGWIKLKKTECFGISIDCFGISVHARTIPHRADCVNNERDYARLRSWVRCWTKLKNTVHCNSVLQCSPRT